MINAADAASRRGAAGRIDTEAIRLAHPIADVVSRYGIDPRHIGNALVGRCPFHEDRGRPNLHLYASGRWICYRCDSRGDAIAFVQRIEQLTFTEAAARLNSTLAQVRPPFPGRRARALRATTGEMRPTRTELEVLEAATSLYANRMLSDNAALAYMARRGFPRDLLEAYQVGYACGDELVAYLRWLKLPLAAARRIGLVTADGREFLRGRVVFPELRHGRPVWLIGRLLEDADGQTAVPGPRYLALPGPKPLLGWDEAIRDPRTVCLVEGPVDLLALRLWGVAGLALLGNIAGRTLRLLDRFEHLYLALDQDGAGRDATARIAREFGARAVPLRLSVKDPGELALRADGEKLFRAALLTAGIAPRWRTS